MLTKVETLSKELRTLREDLVVIEERFENYCKADEESDEIIWQEANFERWLEDTAIRLLIAKQNLEACEC